MGFRVWGKDRWGGGGGVNDALPAAPTLLSKYAFAKDLVLGFGV